MFYEGIVESDFSDEIIMGEGGGTSTSSENYGYVKVRIFGKHTHNKTILPTSDLPNAKIIFSGESNIDEISYFRTICPGTHVIVGFLDKDEQIPVVFGSVTKNLKSLPDFTKGFSDKSSNHPSADYLEEQTISRLARNENIPLTISQTKTNERQIGLNACGTFFNQPSNPYNATYPMNRVLQTKSHIIEIDDTNGHERINIYHKSGTFEEIHPDGTVTKKIKRDHFLSIANEYNVIVNGTINIKSNGTINIQGTSLNLNGTSDTLVSFTDMQTAFNALRTELNALITLYNAHGHGNNGASPPATPGVAAIANMSSANVSSIHVP